MARGFLRSKLRPLALKDRAYGTSGLLRMPKSSAVSAYKYIDGVERLEKYLPGGYHPVQVGDKIQDRYLVVHKLGHGGWSTVWLVQDTQESRYLALKIGISDSLPREIPILKALNEHNPGMQHIPAVHDEFTIEGPNGSHPCYTTSLALCNLRKCSFSQLFYLDVARAIAYELTLAVAYIQERGFAHGDIHLRNVLVLPRNSIDRLLVAEFQEKYGAPEIYPIKREDGGPLTPNVPATATVPLYMGKRAKTFRIQDARIQLSDFGEAFSPAEKARLGRDCHTPADFRPPEAHFEPDTPLSFSSDVWSLVTAIWDIVGMQALFSSAFYTEEVICQITDCLGPFPTEWYNNWEDRGHFFDDESKPTEGRHVWHGIQGAFSECVQDFRRKRDVGLFSTDEEAAVLDMMMQMLKYRPEERITVHELLQSDWMVNWARLDYKRSRLGQEQDTRATSNEVIIRE